ncbi:hypothetical protein Dsin_021423 [Dipteronia sinensis]|uniref:Uncharacterized protein n=1 Tax=Dipteronia sinensis TaxID=43782 RepID=A0AAE0DYT0_9ROSI|nr:hypothetical protein Dsin_021423 [Dipteronia sinensis]
MDFCRNVSVPGECQQEPVMSPPCSKLGSLTSSTSIDDLFPAQNTEVDVSLEWLSIFVEDCLSSTGNCLPVAAAPNTTSSVQTPNTAKPNQPKQPQQTTPPSLQKFVVPSKARSKRKRATTTTTKSICSKSERSQLTSWTHSLYPQDQFSSDPPLLHQTYWLADSELILPKKEEKQNDVEEKNVNVNVNVMMNMMEEEEEDEEEEEGSIGNLECNNNGQQPRRCTHLSISEDPTVEGWTIRSKNTVQCMWGEVQVREVTARVQASKESNFC